MKNVTSLLLGTAMLGILPGCFDSDPKKKDEPKKEHTSEVTKKNTKIEADAKKNADALKDKTQKKDGSKEKNIVDLKDHTKDGAEKILAKFADGHIISQQDIANELTKIPQELQKNYSYADLTRIILEGKINEYVIDLYMKELKFEESPEAKIQLEKLRENVEQKAYLESKATHASTDDIQDKYDALKKDFLQKKKIEVLIRHIVVASQTEAAGLIKELKAKPSEFKSTATKISLDQKTKNKGGELGYVSEGMFPKDFGEKIFSAKPGTVLEQPVPYEDKFSVIQVGESRAAEFPKLEVLKDRIQEMLKAEQILKFLKNTRVKQKVKVFDLTGKEIDEPTSAESEKEPEKDIDVTRVDSNRILIDFGKEKFTVRDLKDFCKENNIEFLYTANAKMYKQIIFQVCHSKIMKGAIKKEAIDKDPKVAKDFANAKPGMLRNLFIERQLEKTLSDSEIEKTYKQIKENIPKGEIEVLIRLIPFDSEKEALDALSQIKKNPSKFSEYVKKSKFDDIKKNDGYLNDKKNAYITRKQLSKEAADVVLKAKSATLVPQVVHNILAGASIPYAIVRVENKRDVQPPRKEEIMDQLKDLTKRRKMGELLKEIRRKIGVVLYDEKGVEIKLEETSDQTMGGVG